ncbi:hypothetical protein EU527_13275 [Candidatus Thorarchaeota archaeon]|nr:MAG: hypothetical protein EU527_13275 [Candidatus Thorarchaeota archaeon]
MNDSTTELPERFRDRDIFEDQQGRLFVTLGFIQPKERVISYLKYIPDEKGSWIRSGTRYRRIFWGSVDSVASGIDLLPISYSAEDKHFQTALIEPPRHVIKKYYSPEKRLLEILEAPQDDLEETTKEAVEFLHDEFEIPIEVLGIAGSILWRGHSAEYSDINMNVYGHENAWALQNNYNLIDDERPHIRLRPLADWDHAIERIVERIPRVSKKNLQLLFARRKAFCVGQRCIGITPVLLPEEAPIEHGSEIYVTVSAEPVSLKVRIENDVYGIFHPALYEIEPIEFEGETVQRIMTYDGAFGGLFHTGDRVEVTGMLQRVVQANTDCSFAQIMVGTKVGSGKEYIRLSD